MLRFSPSRLMIAILAGALATGCKSVARKPASDGRAVARVGEGSQAADKELERLAAAHAHYAAAVIAEMNQRSDTAIEEYYQAAIKDPDNEKLTLELSRKLLQNKQPDKAVELLSKSSERPKASGAIFAQLGFVLSQVGKPDQAIAANRTAIKREPRSIGACY